MRFGTLVADPPWNYSRTSENKSLRGYSDKHYEPLTTASLASLPVAEIIRDDAVLFLWTTSPFLADGSALKVVKGWGFTPVTLLYWHKTKKKDGTSHLGGVGYWFLGNCEPILVAKRGRAYRCAGMKGWSAEDRSALFSAPKLGHSVKPDILHERIERSEYPQPYLELFGRRPREGWTVVGDEIPGGEDIRSSIKRLRHKLI